MTAYKAKTLRGAEREVRNLRRRLREACALLDQYAEERKVLAKLAAEGPCFDNPLKVYEAKKLRDGILAQMRLAPDGIFIS